MPTPAGDYVLLDPVQLEQRSKGGIVIATVSSSEEEAPKIGKVVAFGPGAWDISGVQWLDPSKKVKVGEYWQLLKTGDYGYALNGRKYYLTRMANCIARISEEEIHGRG